MGKSPSGLIFICKFLAWFAGPAMSRWDGGCDDLVHSAGGGSGRTPLQTLRRSPRTSS
jgi:hypothetical protein